MSLYSIFWPACRGCRDKDITLYQTLFNLITMSSDPVVIISISHCSIKMIYLANRNYRIRQYPIKFYNPKSWSLLLLSSSHTFLTRENIIWTSRQRLYPKFRCSDYFCFHSSPTPRHAISNKSDCNCQFSFHSGFCYLKFDIYLSLDSSTEVAMSAKILSLQS